MRPSSSSVAQNYNINQVPARFQPYLGNRVAMKTSSQQDQWIREAAQISRVPEQVIRSIMKIESQGRHYSKNGGVLRSEQNALGSMQVLRETSQRMGVHNPENPRANIVAGAKYLAYLNRYLKANDNWSMVATAYHQGEGTLEKALKKAKRTGNNDWLNNGVVGPKGRDYYRKFTNIQLTGETHIYEPKKGKKLK